MILQEKDKRQQRQSGFTLIELSAVIVVVGLLAGFTARMLTSGVDTYGYIRDRQEALASGRLALQRIVKEVRQTSQPGAIYTATADSIRFIKTNNESVQLRLGNQRVLLNGQPLVDQVTQFRMTYFDTGGRLLDPPIANTAKIWRIRLTLARSMRAQQIVLQQDVVPRNFRN